VSGTVTNVSKGLAFTAAPLPDHVAQIVRAGGLVPWVRAQLGAA
jgi:hypothetical protein